MPSPSSPFPTRVRVAIVGAGFSGLCMAIRLKQAGHDDFVLFERGDEVGGTWRENTYPGCACDIPSHLYSFSFALRPDWSRAYPPQPEIQEYLVRCTDDFGLRPHLRLRTEIEEMRFDSARCVWRLHARGGETFEADVVVSGTGPLNKPSIPALPGLDGFEGETFHSSRWPRDFDATGRRIAVIGTGASAIQIVPEIAPQAERLHVFQRTAPWVVPRMDRAFSALEKRLFRALPPLQRLYRWSIYARQEAGALMFLGHRRLRALAQRAARRQIESVVRDPALRAAVTPDYAIGCKRILISNDWYPALARENVELVTAPLAEVRPRALVTKDGRVREVDAIIFGTGFAATDFLAPMKVFGRRGEELSDAWKSGAATHLGIAVSGFPSLYLLVGPNTGLGHNSIVFMIEAQVGYVLQAIAHRARTRAAALDLRADVQEASYREVQRRMGDTVWLSGCKSWYRSADGRIDTLWPGFTFDYWWRTRRFRPEQFERLETARGNG